MSGYIKLTKQEFIDKCLEYQAEKRKRQDIDVSAYYKYKKWREQKWKLR